MVSFDRNHTIPISAGLKLTETILYFVKQYCSTRYRTTIMIFVSHAGPILVNTDAVQVKTRPYESTYSFPFYFV